MFENIERSIEKLEEISKSNDAADIASGLLYAIQIIKSLYDENQSVWHMIEENRASEVLNHSDVLKQELDKKIHEMFSLISSKVVKA